MSTNVSIIKEEFHDFDQFRDTLLGWDVEVTQLGCGPLRLNWEQVSFEDELALSHLESNRFITPNTVINRDHISFVVCFSPLVFCGLEVSKGSMLIFGPGREYRSLLPEGFETLEMCASNNVLSEAGVNVTDWDFNYLQPERCVLKLSAESVHAFRQLSQTFKNLAGFQQHQNVDLTWTFAARERWLGLIAKALQDSSHVDLPKTKCRTSDWLLTARALELVDRLGSNTRTISSLCESLGCSTRTLQIAFQSVLGMSPLQYVLARRLQQTRLELLAARNDDNVTRIAAGHEFFHFGRFSQYYRALFGELPSDTLKKSYRTRHRK